MRHILSLPAHWPTFFFHLLQILVVLSSHHVQCRIEKLPVAEQLTTVTAAENIILEVHYKSFPCSTSAYVNAPEEPRGSKLILEYEYMYSQPGKYIHHATSKPIIILYHKIF